MSSGRANPACTKYSSAGKAAFIKGEILDRYKDGVILIVGHGVAFKCFIRGVLGSDARMTHKLGMDNLSMTRLTYSDRDGWSLDWMNRPLIPKKV